MVPSAPHCVKDGGLLYYTYYNNEPLIPEVARAGHDEQFTSQSSTYITDVGPGRLPLVSYNLEGGEWGCDNGDTN